MRTPICDFGAVIRIATLSTSSICVSRWNDESSPELRRGHHPPETAPKPMLRAPGGQLRLEERERSPAGQRMSSSDSVSPAFVRSGSRFAPSPDSRQPHGGNPDRGVAHVPILHPARGSGGSCKDATLHGKQLYQPSRPASLTIEADGGSVQPQRSASPAGMRSSAASPHAPSPLATSAASASTSSRLSR